MNNDTRNLRKLRHAVQEALVLFDKSADLKLTSLERIDLRLQARDTLEIALEEMTETEETP